VVAKMTKEKTEKMVEEYTRILITTDGKEIFVSYELEENEDDFFLEGILRSIENSEVSSCDEARITIGGILLDLVDFKKIIGIRYS
jgi:hypothetical protein